MKKFDLKILYYASLWIWLLQLVYGIYQMRAFLATINNLNVPIVAYHWINWFAITVCLVIFHCKGHELPIKVCIVLY